MRSGLKISDISVTMDLDCNFPDYKVPSTFVINFESIMFTYEISRIFKQKATTNVTSPAVARFKVDYFPKNAFTEIIASEMNLNPLKEKLFASLSKWSEILSQLIEASTKNVKFPELCYYCP